MKTQQLLVYHWTWGLSNHKTKNLTHILISDFDIFSFSYHINTDAVSSRSAQARGL